MNVYTATGGYAGKETNPGELICSADSLDTSCEHLLTFLHNLY